MLTPPATPGTRRSNVTQKTGEANLQVESGVVFDEQEVNAVPPTTFVVGRPVNLPMHDGGLETGARQLHVIEQFVQRFWGRSVSLDVTLMLRFDVLEHRLYCESVRAT